MDGVHDLGGRRAFGAVVVEVGEPVFHAGWEATARALLLLVTRGARTSTAELRHSIERMDPGHYLSSPYYEHWLTAAATLAVEHGIVTADELEHRAGGRFPLSHPVRANPPTSTTPGDEPRFSVGERVRVRDQRPPGHTRCPWYVRGRTGTVARLDGRSPVPDLEAHGGGRVPEHTYDVAFPGEALWDDAEPGVVVHVDLWERYLEAPP